MAVHTGNIPTPERVAELLAKLLADQYGVKEYTYSIKSVKEGTT